MLSPAFVTSFLSGILVKLDVSIATGAGGAASMMPNVAGEGDLISYSISQINFISDENTRKTAGEEGFEDDHDDLFHVEMVI